MKPFNRKPPTVTVKKLTTVLKISIALIACLSLTACACGSNIRTVQRQNNLSTYLYSGKEPLAEIQQKKPLSLPAKVGITFVPTSGNNLSIPETTKKQVMESVRLELAKHKKCIAVAHSIPSSYLQPQGGIAELERIAGQFDVDVIVLLSANQLQKYERNPLAAFMDVTIVGSYMIPGTTVDTSTLLEATVIHMPSRALVFRTEGSDETHSRATQFGSSGTALNDSVASIEDASKNLVASIGKSLSKFEKFDATRAVAIRTLPNPVVDRQNYWENVNEYKASGGGAFDIGWIVLIGASAVCAAGMRNRR